MIYFQGPVPTDLASMASLKKLVIQNNMLTGEIPKAICSMDNLTYCDISRNDLTGKPEFGQLRLGNPRERERYSLPLLSIT